MPWMYMEGKGRNHVFENRAVSIMFGPKRDEVTGGWRKLRSEELHHLCSSPDNITVNQIKKDEMSNTCISDRELRNSYKSMVRNSEGKR
jgi:hypothetical protein